MKVRRGHAHARIAARIGSRPGGCVLLITNLMNLGSGAPRAVPAAPEGELSRLRTVDGRGRPAPRAVPAAPGRELSKLPTVDFGHSCPIPRAVLAA